MGGSNLPKVGFETSILGVYILYTLRHVFWSTKTFENSVEHVYIDVSHREESIHSGFTDCTQLVGKLRVKTAFWKPHMVKNARNCCYFTHIWGSEGLSLVAINDHNFVTTGPQMLTLSVFESESYFIHGGHFIWQEKFQNRDCGSSLYYTSFALGWKLPNALLGELRSTKHKYDSLHTSAFGIISISLSRCNSPRRIER